MYQEVLRIFEFIVNSIIHIWPYLLITIPFAVFIRVSGKFKAIESLLKKRPLVSILIATILGAFSPFCSCGVIPVIASLLIGGVPIAPVMAFWLASPSMDPEIFFLSVSVLGWELAFWRLGATFVMSFAGGYLTHMLVKKEWLKGNLLKTGKTGSIKTMLTAVGEKLIDIKTYFSSLREKEEIVLASNCCEVKSCCNTTDDSIKTVKQLSNCCDIPKTVKCCSDTAIIQEKVKSSCCNIEEVSFKSRLTKESFNAATMVIKFMVIAFFLEALIIFYIPSEVIITLLGDKNPLAVLTAALIGVPVYTSNLTALPIVGGLLTKGMTGGTALAFLISGPTTTIPAMAAVWNLAVKKVFFIYVIITLLSAIAAGYLFDIIAGI